MKRLTLLIGCLILLAISASAQSMSSSGSGNWSIAAVSNFTDCSTGGLNCWHASHVMASKVFSDAAGLAYAIDSNNVGYAFSDYPTNMWNSHPEWGSVYELHYGTDSNLYALYDPAGSTCTGHTGWHSIGRRNGSAWTNLVGAYCFTSFSIAQDGSGWILAIDGNGALWQCPNFASSSCSIYNTVSYPFISVSAVNGTSGSYLLVRSNHTMWDCLGTSCSQIAGSALQIQADSAGGVYMLSSVDGTVNHRNRSSGWDRLNGGMAYMANGGSQYVWGIGAPGGNNNVYRFSDTGIQFSRTYSGSVSCTIPPPGNGVCNTFTHNANLQISVQGHSSSIAHQQFTGPGTWAITANVNANDLFDCVETGGDCTPIENTGNMQCSGGGNNLDQPQAPVPTFHYNNFTQSKFVSKGTCWPTGPKLENCDYFVVQHCSPSTSPPNYNPTVIEDFNFNKWGIPNPAGWFLYSFVCASLQPVGYRLGGWFCSPSKYSNVETPVLLDTYPCTSTP
jgi:hypothetical protein